MLELPADIERHQHEEHRPTRACVSAGRPLRPRAPRVMPRQVHGKALDDEDQAERGHRQIVPAQPQHREAHDRPRPPPPTGRPPAAPAETAIPGPTQKLPAVAAASRPCAPAASRGSRSRIRRCVMNAGCPSENRPTKPLVMLRLTASITLIPTNCDDRQRVGVERLRRPHRPAPRRAPHAQAPQNGCRGPLMPASPCCGRGGRWA